MHELIHGETLVITRTIVQPHSWRELGVHVSKQNVLCSY